MNEKITISEDGYLMLQGSWTDEEAATYFGKTSEKIKNLHIVADGFEHYAWLKTLTDLKCLVMERQNFDASILPNGLTTLDARRNTITSLSTLSNICPELTALYIGWCRNPPNDLNWVLALTNLDILCLSGLNIYTVEEISKLQALPLTELFLIGNGFSWPEEENKIIEMFPACELFFKEH